MKQIFISMVLAITLLSCSSDDEKPMQREASIMDYSFVGYWRSKPFFLTIDENNFLTSYIAEKFLDSGECTVNYDYEKENIIITCHNTYFQRNTIYTITSLKGDSMVVRISYIDLKGIKQDKTLKMGKSTATPASKDNLLIGKTCITKTSPHVTTFFNTYDTGTRMTDIDSAKDWPLSIFYIYCGHIYIQEFNKSKAPVITDWNEYADTGNIKYITAIEKDDGSIEFGGEHSIEDL